MERTPPMPELFMISPAGFIVDVNYTGVSPYYELAVTEPLQHPGVTAKGVGDTLLHSELSGRQGTLEVFCLVGATGTARSLVFLVDNLSSPTKYIGVALDTSNRPYVLVSVDGAGGTYALSTPVGSTIPSGTRLDVRLVFNAFNPVDGAYYVAIQVAETIINLWVTEPLSTWEPFLPGALCAGSAVAGLAAFNGTIQKVQANSSVELIEYNVHEVEVDSMSSVVRNVVVIDAGLGVDRPVASDLDGSVAIAAGIGVVQPVASAMTADVAIAAQFTNDRPVASAMTADVALVAQFTNDRPVASAMGGDVDLDAAIIANIGLGSGLGGSVAIAADITTV
jgi:hypothetical protein